MSGLFLPFKELSEMLCWKRVLFHLPAVILAGILGTLYRRRVSVCDMTFPCSWGSLGTCWLSPLGLQALSCYSLCSMAVGLGPAALFCD